MCVQPHADEGHLQIRPKTSKVGQNHHDVWEYQVITKRISKELKVVACGMSQRGTQEFGQLRIFMTNPSFSSLNYVYVILIKI